MNGSKPVVAIFAREMNDSLAGLVKKVEAATVENKSSKLSSFVVLCSDDQSVSDKAKAFINKEKIKKTIFAIDNPSGPPSYKIAKEADITVVLYVKKSVKANFAFKKGEFKESDIDSIIKDISKITK